MHESGHRGGKARNHCFTVQFLHTRSSFDEQHTKTGMKNILSLFPPLTMTMSIPTNSSVSIKLRAYSRPIPTTALRYNTFF